MSHSVRLPSQALFPTIACWCVRQGAFGDAVEKTLVRCNSTATQPKAEKEDCTGDGWVGRVPVVLPVSLHDRMHCRCGPACKDRNSQPNFRGSVCKQTKSTEVLDLASKVRARLHLPLQKMRGDICNKVVQESRSASSKGSRGYTMHRSHRRNT